MGRWLGPFDIAHILLALEKLFFHVIWQPYHSRKAVEVVVVSRNSCQGPGLWKNTSLFSWLWNRRMCSSKSFFSSSSSSGNAHKRNSFCSIVKKKYENRLYILVTEMYVGEAEAVSALIEVEVARIGQWKWASSSPASSILPLLLLLLLLLDRFDELRN